MLQLHQIPDRDLYWSNTHNSKRIMAAQKAASLRVVVRYPLNDSTCSESDRQPRFAGMEISWAGRLTTLYTPTTSNGTE